MNKILSNEEFTSSSSIESECIKTEEEIDLPTLGGHYAKIERGFVCEIDDCKQIFHRKKDYDLHVYQHTGEKTVECVFEGCLNKFVVRSSMIRHLKKFHPKYDRIAQVAAKITIEKKYKCDYDGCNEEFLRKRGLDSHMFEHTGLKTVDCPIDGCDKVYVNMQGLKRHLKMIHLDAELKSCKAPNCKQKFETIEIMQEHYNKSHLNEKNHHCTECSEAFRRKMDLKKHMYKHTSEYPFNCVECSKGFISNQKLTKHLETHTGKKCQYCPQIFKNWTLLVRHQKNEHSSDPKCEECGKLFKTRAYLRRHLKLHIRQDERETFECTYENCTRSYTQYNNLQTHIKSAHQSIFKCTVEGCTKFLSSKRRLLHHIKMHEEPMHKSKRKNPTFTKPKKSCKRVSTASQLVNIENPFELEKQIVLGHGENIIIEDDDMSLSEAILDASDIEDSERKTPQKNSTETEYLNCVQEVIRKDYNSDSGSSTIIAVH